MVTTQAISQSIGSYNISTVGKSAMSSQGGLYFAVGEPMNATVSGDGNTSLAQGFLQVAIESGTTETKELLLSTLKVFPNPVSHELHLELQKENEAYRASLYNSIGQLMAKTNFDSAFQKIDLSALAPGTYFLRLDNEEKNIGSYSIIKQ